VGGSPGTQKLEGEKGLFLQFPAQADSEQSQTATGEDGGDEDVRPGMAQRVGIRARHRDQDRGGLETGRESRHRCLQHAVIPKLQDVCHRLDTRQEVDGRIGGDVPRARDIGALDGPGEAGAARAVVGDPPATGLAAQNADRVKFRVVGGLEQSPAEPCASNWPFTNTCIFPEIAAVVNV